MGQWGRAIGGCAPRGKRVVLRKRRRLPDPRDYNRAASHVRDACRRLVSRLPFQLTLTRTSAHTMPRRLVHTEIIPIRWGDMDAQSHVNNTVYFRYMEQARISLFDKLGLRDQGENLPPNCAPVVITASCTYLRALVYPGDVEVKVFLDQPGRASVMTYYEMRPSYDPEVLYAEGACKQCWVDSETQRSIPLPQAIRDLIEETSSS
jgi:acyl-CoA thioester hydrolase